jgi:5S rRNA maturation endonuclease (ribonuclease M5)
VTDYSRFYSEHLKAPKWRADGEGSAKCPFHEDRKASLSVNRVNGLWFCHACNNGGTARDFAGRLKVEAPSGGRKSAEYAFDYPDEKGALLYQVVRFAGKEFRQRRPDGKGGWAWNLEGVPRVLYRLPELLKTKGNVFIVEGEKDVETLRAQRLTATCNSGGAGKWRDEYGGALRNRVCILLPDNDDPGRAHMRDVAEKLKPFVAEVRTVELRNLPPKGDVSDWFAQGHAADELLSLVDAAEKTADTQPALTSQAARNWPEQPGADAFHGLAGEFVALTKPHTEADPAALLLQFLVMFGCYVGRGPRRLAGKQEHHLTEYVIIVGPTKTGRKGTGYSEVEWFMRLVDRDWLDGHKSGGLVSGEGLIWAVRDPIVKRVAVKSNGKPTGEYTDTIEDQGIDDKRLPVIETEYSMTLKAAGRDGSTLSDVLRKAWDGSVLGTLAKVSPARATGAHICIIGHITPDELLRNLDSTEAANGFGNRHLWCASRRWQELPWGGSVQDTRINDLVRHVRSAAEQARRVGEFQFDEPAAALWVRSYHELSADRPGLLGAMVARSEAHVLRLAMLYAALGGSETIREAHLKAALAVWDYCERSAGFFFGDRMGDPIADAVIEALRNSPDGLTTTEIHALFSRHAKSNQIEAARGRLLKYGRIKIAREETGGRPGERWRVI